MNLSSAFNESLFEKKLLQLRETHESISSLSTWCLAHQGHHAKIVSIWLSVLKRVKIEHRLLLFYLANDVIQYSRRKHLPFVETFAPALQKATTMVREDNVKNKVLRLFKIWDDRGIYDEAFLLDLSGLLICDPKGGNRMDIQDFQPNVMYSRIRSCKKLEDDTDLKLKVLNESRLPLTDVDQLRRSLKDREHGEDVMEDVENALRKIKAYVDALEAEIKERSGLLDMLDTGEQYYEKDLKEAKIVVNAYKCFGQRVKQVQKKLAEKAPSLPSPVPSPPDINAPSPSPPLSLDEDRDLSNFNASNFTMGDSFINNTGIIEKALDSQNSFHNDNNSFFPPAVYTPSMTTGQVTGRDVPYTPTLPSRYGSGNTSFDSRYNSTENVYNSSYEEDNQVDNARNSDSQLSSDSYPAEYFIGNNSSDATGFNDREKRDGDMFSSLMDGRGGLLPPPPPPPPPRSPAQENRIEVIGGSTKQPSVAEILQSLVGKNGREMSIPLKPPPLPPALQEEPEPDWEDNDWDSPLSPPYQDFPPIVDTDMRPKDIDHRNLISLTGWDSKTQEDSNEDKDERKKKLYHDSDSSDSRSPPDHIPRLNLGPLNIPPPPILTHPPPVMMGLLESGESQSPTEDFAADDNVENIDMEMSDEEEKRETSPSMKKTPFLAPPPIPNMALLDAFHSGSLRPPSSLLPTPNEASPIRPPRPPLVRAPMNTPPPGWIPPQQFPHRSPVFQQRQPHRQFNPRGFRHPRFFRPRFQPRW